MASFSISTYQNYLIKSKVTEAIIYGGRAKLAVTEFYQTQGVFPSTNAEAGLNSNIISPSVSAVLISQGGMITITTSIPNAVGTIVLRPTAINNSVRWSCEALFLDPKYLPSACT